MPLSWERVKLPGGVGVSLYRSHDGRFEIERLARIWQLVDTDLHRHHQDYSTAIATLAEAKTRAQERVEAEEKARERTVRAFDARQPKKDDLMRPLDCGIRRIVEIRDGVAMDLDGVLGGIGGNRVPVDRLVYSGGNIWRELER
jgi:hypothetical protein